jgi:hypothetical protein
MNVKRTLRTWTKAALRPKPDPKPQSSASIVCDAVPLLIKTEKRLMKLAPLLFDTARIEEEVSKRVWDVTFQEKFGGRSWSASELDALAHVPDPGPAAEPKIRQDIPLEAWAALSPRQEEEVSFYWRFCELIWDVLLKAQKGLEVEMFSGELKISEALKLMRCGLELDNFRSRWSPALPDSLPLVTEQPAEDHQDPKLIKMMEQISNWQSEINLKMAA